MNRIVTFALVALALGATLMSSPGRASEPESLMGNWKLISFFTEDLQTKQRNNVYGEHPTGSLGFTKGRFFGFVTAEGRKVPQTPEDHAAAFRSMLAYTGKWRVEGNKFITKVDVSWNPGWVGSEQTRYWRVEGNMLFITTAPIPNPNAAGNMMVGTLVWEKER